jgi:SAM-dependent methyltransferase
VRVPSVPLIVARERLAKGVDPREPEAMVMDDPQEVAEYDQAGATLQLPVHHCNALALNTLLAQDGVALDLGCGSARQLVRLALGRPDARLVGWDLSGSMLETGRRLVSHEGVAGRVELLCGDITDRESEPPPELSLVCCNFAVHQLPSEDLVVACLENIARMRQETGCAVYIFDLVRLHNRRSWPAIVSLAKVPGEAFLRDAIASERASFTFEECSGLLQQAGLGDLQHARAGLLGEYQLHWTAAREIGARGRWRRARLPRGTRLAVSVLRRSFPGSLMRAS